MWIKTRLIELKKKTSSWSDFSNKQKDNLAVHEKNWSAEIAI